MQMKILMGLTLIALASCSQTIEAQQNTKQAKEFFKKFSTLEAAFDPAVVDLYADQAILRNIRRYPNGLTFRQN